jgi:hypothetical protein
MKATTNKVLGFINQEHIDEVESIFGAEISERLKNSTNKTFLQILVESGKFDLTNNNSKV